MVGTWVQSSGLCVQGPCWSGSMVEVLEWEHGGGVGGVRGG
jgi:hypothetical protein